MSHRMMMMSNLMGVISLFQYSCGGWINLHPVRNDDKDDVRHILGEMEIDNTKAMRNVLGNKMLRTMKNVRCYHIPRFYRVDDKI